MTREKTGTHDRESRAGRTDRRSRKQVGDVTVSAETGATRTGPLSWAILGGVVLSLVVIPAIVLGITEFGLASTLGIPRQLALGGLAMVPGVVLGIVSILVMLTPD